MSASQFFDSLIHPQTHTYSLSLSVPISLSFPLILSLSLSLSVTLSLSLSHYFLLAHTHIVDISEAEILKRHRCHREHNLMTYLFTANIVLRGSFIFNRKTIFFHNVWKHLSLKLQWHIHFKVLQSRCWSLIQYNWSC